MEIFDHYSGMVKVRAPASQPQWMISSEQGLELIQVSLVQTDLSQRFVFEQKLIQEILAKLQ